MKWERGRRGERGRGAKSKRKKAILHFWGEGELRKKRYFFLLLSLTYFAGDYNRAAPCAKIRLLLQERFPDEEMSDLGE